MCPRAAFMLDEQEFKQMYNEHADRVYNVCINYLHNTEEAEEATQDVFVKAYNSFTSFQGQAKVSTWLYRIAVNQCLDQLKARKRKKRFAYLVSILPGEESRVGIRAVNFNHPGVQLEDKEGMEKIYRCIESLPDRQQTALILKTLEHQSVKEIAEIMEMSPKAVESLLSRAKQNL